MPKILYGNYTDNYTPEIKLIWIISDNEFFNPSSIENLIIENRYGFFKKRSHYGGNRIKEITFRFIGPSLKICEIQYLILLNN